jgi:hypothetical protein
MIPEFLHRFGEDATKWFTGEALSVYKEVKWNATKGTTLSAKERDSDEMVKEDLWDLNDQWEKLKEAPTTDPARPDSAVLDGSNGLNPPNPPTEANNVTDTNNATNEDLGDYPVNRLASDKSIASFGNVYQRPTDADDIIEAEHQAREAAANAVDPSGTQFEFSTDQLERDRQKALNGPSSTGFSMSTAAKTTPSTRLKLKEAQEEIGELRLALAKQAQPAKNIETMPPEATEDDMQIDTFTEIQALRAAVTRAPRSTPLDGNDDMEIDGHAPIYLGHSSTATPSADTSATSEDTVQLTRVPRMQEITKDTPIIEIGSSSAPSSDSSESSKSSTSSSSSSNEDTSDSDDTDEFLAKLNNQATRQPKTKSKNTVKFVEPSGANHASAGHRSPDRHSGSRRDHQLTPGPNGQASDRTKAAGQGD